MIDFLRSLCGFIRAKWSQLAISTALAFEPTRIIAIAEISKSHPICAAVGILGFCIINAIAISRLSRADDANDSRTLVADVTAAFDRGHRELAEAHSDFLARVRSIQREGEGWKRGEKD